MGSEANKSLSQFFQDLSPLENSFSKGHSPMYNVLGALYKRIKKTMGQIHV